MLEKNVKSVREKIEQALARRTEDKVTGKEVTLVAVTKNHPADVITEVLACDVNDIGENRVQEAKAKQELLGKQGTWHLIGHLQTNKVKQAVSLFDCIQSVDSERLLAAIDKEAGKVGKCQKILLEVNIGGEEQKSGFSLEEYRNILPELPKYESIELCGLMTVAPAAADAEEVRWVFAKGYELFKELKAMYPQVDILSMGMTHDYEVAIEEGANMIRVGTALFGQRDYTFDISKVSD